MSASVSQVDRSAWQPRLEFALILLVFFIDGGAAAPHVNEAHYLTKAKHYWDASYCPGDQFLDSADPHVAFYWTIGWLTRFLPLAAVAWIGRLAAWILLAAGWQRLSSNVVPIPWASALSAALWVTLLRDGVQNFAGEWVVGGIEAKCFAYGLFLFGMAALARGEWRWPWIWFGAASAFHVLVGAWAVLAALGVWLTEPRATRATLRTLLPGLALGGALSLIGLIPSLALEWGTDPQVNAEASRIYVFERLPHHLAPLSLPAAEVRWRLTYLGGMTAACVALAIWLWRRRANKTELESAGIESPAAARILRFAALSLGGALAGLAMEWALDHDRLAAARVLRYYWFRQVDVALPLAIAIVGAAWTAAMLRSRHALARVGALGPIVWAGYFLLSVTYARWETNVPPSVVQADHAEAWQEACRWVAEHAPADAKFLIPRGGHSFKWYASRSDVGSYKDVPQDAAGVVEWRARNREMYPTLESLDERGRKIILDSPELLGTERVQELAKKYGASHVIARNAPPLALPRLYSTSDQFDAEANGYTIYETGVAPSASTP